MQNKTDILIAKKLSGNATEAELAELQLWLDASPENTSVFEETRRMWHLSGTLRAPEENVNVGAAWEEFQVLSAKRKTEKSGVTFYLKAAAVFLVVLLAIVIMRVIVVPPVEGPVLASQAAHRADTFLAPAPAVSQQSDSFSTATPSLGAPAKRRARKAPQVVMIAVSSEDSAMVFTLPDNTKVFLNTNSKLVYPEKFASGPREVFLSGEAYFEPAQAQGEFFVYCHDTKTRALGNALNIKGMRDGVVEISAIAGNLEVSRRNDLSTPAVLVKPGEQLRYDTTTHKVSKSGVSRRDKWWKYKNFRSKMRDFFSRILPGKTKNKN